MTWAPAEWEAFAALLEEGWPGPFDDSTEKAWRVLLDSTSPQTAVLALRRLLLEGRRFRPSVSELLAATRADPSRPTFDEAYPTIYRAGAIGTIADGAHPLVIGFISRQGLERLGHLPLDDPQWGEKTRRDLREAWDRHVEAFDGREIHAIASGSSGLRQLDPLASLQQIEAG